MKKIGSECAAFVGILMLSALFAMSATTKEVIAQTKIDSAGSQQLIAQVTSNDPRWQAADDQNQETVAAESDTATTPQRWYERPSGAQQRPVDQPVLQHGAPPAERTWYQEEIPAARQPHVSVPIERKEEAIGGGRPGGVLPDMPQRGMTGRDMGPAGTARQPPAFSSFDRGVGPGAVSSGIGMGRFPQEGVVRTEEEPGKTTFYMDDGSVIELHHAPRSGGRDTYVHWPAPGSEGAGNPTIYYYDDDGNLVVEGSSENQQQDQQTGSTDQQQEEDLGIELAPIPPDEEDDDTDGEPTPESRSGDPDDWYGGEAPPSRTGVGDTLQDRRPARDGRVGGETDDERESVHAPRPELDIVDQAGERAGQVGDRRERGPGFQIRLPEDHLGDPPGGGGTR